MNLDYTVKHQNQIQSKTQKKKIVEKNQLEKNFFSD